MGGAVIGNIHSPSRKEDSGSKSCIVLAAERSNSLATKATKAMHDARVKPFNTRIVPNWHGPGVPPVPGVELLLVTTTSRGSRFMSRPAKSMDFIVTTQSEIGGSPPMGVRSVRSPRGSATAVMPPMKFCKTLNPN